MYFLYFSFESWVLIVNVFSFASNDFIDLPSLLIPIKSLFVYGVNTLSISSNSSSFGNHQSLYPEYVLSIWKDKYSLDLLFMLFDVVSPPPIPATLV